MKHCILVKYVDEVNIERKEQLLGEIEAVFAPLLDTEGVHGIEVIPNMIQRENRYDILIRIEMDPEVLPVYDASEPHHIWKSQYGKYVAKKAIFDYE